MEPIELVAQISQRGPMGALGFGSATFLLAGVLVQVSPPSRPSTSAKVLVAALAGSVCGALSVLLLSTVIDVARPGTMTVSVTLGVWAATGLAVAICLSRPHALRQAWGQAAVAVGVHALALPIAAAISFVVAGAKWSPVDTTSLELSADVLGVRLAGTSATVRLGVAGFLLGLLLVSVGDRVLRRARVRRSASITASRM